jgi:methyltransferase
MRDTVVAYTLLVAFVALQRLVELSVARKNAERARLRGAVEAGAGHYPVMVALHAGFLLAAPLEVWLLERPFRPGLAVAMIGVLVVSAALRAWVVRTLGWRWTTRVLVVPGLPPIRRGPYRFLRHPNYVAVVLEIAALPLVHGAWLTALGFSSANLALLARRVRVEDQALAEGAGRAPERAAVTRGERNAL